MADRTGRRASRAANSPWEPPERDTNGAGGQASRGVAEVDRPTREVGVYRRYWKATSDREERGKRRGVLGTHIQTCRR